MINLQNLARHELIGLKAKVVEAKNKAAVGINGMITDETQKTLEIDGKKVFKAGSLFEFQLNGDKVKVDGDEISGRPWERIKKK